MSIRCIDDRSRDTTSMAVHPGSTNIHAHSHHTAFSLYMFSNTHTASYSFFTVYVRFCLGPRGMLGLGGNACRHPFWFLSVLAGETTHRTCGQNRMIQNDTLSSRPYALVLLQKKGSLHAICFPTPCRTRQGELTPFLAGAPKLTMTAVRK